MCVEAESWGPTDGWFLSQFWRTLNVFFCTPGSNRDSIVQVQLEHSDTCFLASDFTTVFLETSSGQTGKYQDKKLINKNSNKKRLRCVFAKTTEDYVAVKSPISFFLVKRKLWMHLSTRCCRYVVKFLCQINYACCVTRRIKSLLV